MARGVLPSGQRIIETASYATHSVEAQTAAINECKAWIATHLPGWDVMVEGHEASERAPDVRSGPMRLVADEHWQALRNALIDGRSGDPSSIDGPARFRDEETVIIDVTPLAPDQIAQVVRDRRATSMPGQDPLVAIANLVEEWLAATSAVQRITAQQGGPGACNYTELPYALARQDRAKRSLIVAVHR